MCVEHRTLLLASKVLQTLAVSSSCVNSLTPSACKIGHVPTCGIVLKHTRALNKKLKRKEATPDFIWLSTSTLQDTCYHHYERVLSTCTMLMGAVCRLYKWTLNGTQTFTAQDLLVDCQIRKVMRRIQPE